MYPKQDEMAVTQTADATLSNIASPINYATSYPLPLPSGMIDSYQQDIYRE